MKKQISKKCMALLLVLTTIIMSAICILPKSQIVASAVSKDYPAQLVNIANYNNTKNLNISGYTDSSALAASAANGSQNQNWRFDWVGESSKGAYFKITNMGCGRQITPLGYSVKAGTKIVTTGSETKSSQHWYVTPVDNDSYGFGLYYKIVNYDNPNLAITINADNNITLANYSGANSQKFLLNSTGLQGFAGYCKDTGGKTKSSTIGGLLGQTVEVNNFNDLKKYATSDKPYTIVVTNDISIDTYKLDSANHYYCPDGRIYMHSNKTIIGSYGAHKLYNVQFCTATKNGVGNNIIIKNFEISHSEKSNGNDSIQVYFGSGNNLWVDHCSFIGHSAVNTQGSDRPDWDKFLACCYDADFCTVSDNTFGLHEYALILGYPTDTQEIYQKYNNHPNMTIADNHFNNAITRAPGLMRYGYFHSLNNFVENFDMGYTNYTASKLYSENNYFKGGTRKGSVVNDKYNSNDYSSKAIAQYTDSGSILENPKYGFSLKAQYAKPCAWRPSSNYSYKSLTAQQAKDHTSKYAGAQTSRANMMYVTADKPGVPAASYVEKPDPNATSPSEEIVPANIPLNKAFMLKNVNSGLYMEVEGGKAENGANVQQWGADKSQLHNTWRAIPAENGYYYLQSEVGNKTYVLDVTGRKADNGTNIEIYSYKASDNQKFMFTKNSDGSYKIRTKISGEKSAVEVANADKTSGANAQEWEVNGANCQDWELVPVDVMSEKMDESTDYMFQNVNSGLYMEVKDGKALDAQNIQQWEANGSGENKSGDWNTFSLKEFSGGGGLYYIFSNLSKKNDFCLKAATNADGGNIQLAAYSSKDSSMLFKFVKNPDGSYYILPHTMKDAGAVEVASASKDKGGNVGQWTINGNNCQRWNMTAIKKPVVTTTTTTTTTKPVTTTAKPVTTTAKPVTTTAKPVTTTAKPVTTTAKPVTTTAKPVTTTAKPVTTSTTTKAPIITTTAPVTTSLTTAPVTTTAKPETTTEAPKTTTAIITTTKVPASETAQTDIENVNYGDVNCDGVVNISDVVLLNKSIINATKLSPIGTLNADCYDEAAAPHIINVNDSITLLKKLVSIYTQADLPIKG